MTRTLFEALEVRQLLSAVGPATVFDSAVRTDEKFVFQDLVKFKKDGIKSNKAFIRDIRHLDSDGLSQAPAAKSEVPVFGSAVIQANEVLVQDNLAETTPIKNDEKAILVEQKKLAHDAKNATAEAADVAQLKTDRTQIQTDMDNLIQTRITGRENAYNAVLSDAQTLTSDIDSDTQASPKLLATKAQLNTDASNCATTLSSDLQQVSTDATQLDSDLTASQSQQ